VSRLIAGAAVVKDAIRRTRTSSESVVVIVQLEPDPLFINVQPS
jgi:hypothetical protein